MINSIKITNYRNESLEITLREAVPKHGLLITKIEGLGPVKATINMKDNSLVDGSKFNSARAQKRNIVLTMRLLEAPTIEDSRQLTYKYFPLKKRLRFQVDTDNRSLYTYGYVESNEPDIFSDKETVKISILCEDAYLHMVDAMATSTVSVVNPKFEFPFDNNSLNEKLIEFGEIERKQECNVFYEGDVETGVLIKGYAYGTVKNVTIYNILTRGRIIINTDIVETLTGQGIVSGDTVIINTNIGQQNAQLLRGGTYYNILNAIDKRNLEWFVIAKGDNLFTYAAEEGDVNFLLEFQNDILYEGI